MLTPWYITGFCEGEAAFTYSRAGGTFALYFSIKQKEESREILAAIQEYFGYIGKIYGHSPAQSSAYYRVTKIQELKRVVGHFDKYPLQSKKKNEAYRVWRQMVMHKIEHYRGIDYEKLRTLAEKLSGLNARSRAFQVHKR